MIIYMFSFSIYSYFYSSYSCFYSSYLCVFIHHFFMFLVNTSSVFFHHNLVLPSSVIVSFLAVASSSMIAFVCLSSPLFVSLYLCPFLCLSNLSGVSCSRCVQGSTYQEIFTCLISKISHFYPAALKGSGVLSYPERAGGRAAGQKAPLTLSRP